MGVFDHSKQWEFELRASPDACESAFRASFGKKQGNMLRRARWHVDWVEDDDGSHLQAAYAGRAGLADLATITSRFQADQAEAAKGSTIAFSIRNPDEQGVVRCSMWLKGWSSAMGPFGTSDSAIFRNYMRGVEENLRSLDADLKLAKG